VRSAVELKISARVGGPAIRTAGHSGLKPGLRLERGELLCLIDTTDYALELKRLQTQLLLAEGELRLAEEGLALAQREEQRLAALLESDNASRRAYEQAQLQVISREERLLSLRSQVGKRGTVSLALEQAGLDFGRCFVRAPFDLEIAAGELLPGTLLSPGTLVAEVISLEELEVSLPLPASKAKRLSRPGDDGPREVMLFPADSRIETGNREGADGGGHWRGRVAYLSGRIDPLSQTREVLVRIPGGQAGLWPGTMVEAVLEGRPVSHGFSIPRRALRMDGSVLLCRDGRLVIQEAEAVLPGDATAIIVAGPADGDSLVLTAIQDPVPGMLLAVRAEDVR